MASWQAAIWQAGIWCRRWLAALLAVMIVCAPVMAETAADWAAEETCHSADLHQDKDGGDPVSHQGHHAHSCGSCHFHILSTRFALPGTAPAGIRLRAPVSRNAIVSALPDGLFRPPRR